MPTMSRMKKQMMQQRRRKNLTLMRSLKTGPCVDCHKRFHFAAMDFDHVRKAKTRQVSAMLTCSLERVLEEIAKCELVCSNCHRIRSWKRRRQAEPAHDEPIEDSENEDDSDD